MADELSCKEFVELVTAYLELALDELLAQRVAQHLRECEGCAAYLEQIRQTIALLGTLADSSTAPDSKAALLALFRSHVSE
jgi:predicted anti-sigma-YlaC factor YlaD